MPAVKNRIICGVRFPWSLPDSEAKFIEGWLRKYPLLKPSTNYEDLFLPYQAAPTPEGKKAKRFRADFVWVFGEEMRERTGFKGIDLEIQGGRYMRNGGHSSIRGIARDAAKTNAASADGWQVLLVSWPAKPAELITHYAAMHRTLSSAYPATLFG